MVITTQMVDKVARLAKLVLNSQEEEWFQKELQAIFDYIQLLNQFPDALEEVVTEAQTPSLRDDTFHKSEALECIIQQAPHFANKMFVVPRVLDRD